MSKRKESGNTKNKKLFLIIFLISTLLMIGGAGYLIYSVALLDTIENLLRLVGSIVLGFICLILILFGIRFLRKTKKVKFFIVIILMLVIAFGGFFVARFIGNVYGTLASISDTDGYTTYSSSIVALKDSSANDIDDIDKSSVIGITSDKNSIDGYEIPQEIIKDNNLKNEVKEYDNQLDEINDLLSGEIDYAFLPTNYSVMYASMEGYEDLKDKTKIVYTQTKKVKDKKENNSTKPITEPFTVLLMGVDSEKEGIENSTFNGDSLMLLTFNPETLSTTMLSIPRDSYVPIACFAGQRKNKITHAAWKGESCMIDTIQNFLDVKIDYYVKINFKGVVKLVDALGGVQVDVPYNLCEQNSNREWGNNTVYIEKGLQNLNGEQALAFARNRHPNPGKCSSKWTDYTSNDFIRGEHQQEVVTALLDKIKDVRSIDTINNLLDTIGSNMTTNMSTSQILSLYNVFKDIMAKSGDGSITDALGIQRLKLNGYDARIVDYGGTNLSLYDFVLYDDSVKAVSNAMKENLGLKKTKVIKSFSFDVNTPYEEEVIGAKVTGKKSLVQLPSFVGETLSYAQSYCSSHGIKVNVKGGNGYIISQSVPAGANVEDVNSITLTAGGSTSSSTSKSSTSSSSSSSTTDGGNSNSGSGGNSGSGDGSGSGGSGSGGDSGSEGGSGSGGNSGSGGGSVSGDDIIEDLLPQE